MALFAGVECCLKQLPAPGRIVMHSGGTDGTPTTDFICDVGEGVVLPVPMQATCWNRFVEILDRLRATVEVEGVPCYFRVCFPLAGEP
jgi:hypothetical protein